MTWIILLWVIIAVLFQIAALWRIAAWIYNKASDPKEVDRTFFSTCPVGKIIIPMNGANTRCYISNARGFDLDENGILYFINEKDPRDKSLKIKLDPTSGHILNPERFQNLTGQTYTSLLDSLWGVHWLGLPPMGRLHSIKSEWNQVTKRIQSPMDPNQEPGVEIDFGFKPRSEKIATFSMVHNYGWVAKNLETGKGKQIPADVAGAVRTPKPDRVAIDVYIFGPIVIVNANLALMMINWTEGVDAVVKKVCTNYCGNNDTDKLSEDGGKELISKLWEMNSHLLAKYGVVFYHLEYNGWDFSGTPAEKAEIRRVSRLQWEAKQKADAAREAADAEVYTIKEKGLAEAGAITAKGNAENAVIVGRVKGYVENGGIHAGALANADALKTLKPGVTLSLGGQGISILAQPGKKEQNENSETV